MALGEARERLSCGRLIDDLWASIELPPGEHELTCAQCQGARLSLGVLVSLTRDLQRSSGLSADYRPGASVKAAVMRVARAEVRRGRRISVVADRLGRVEISEQTVSAVIRFAADGVVGVHARRCSVASVAESGPSKVVDVLVRLALHSRAGIAEATEEVRERVDAVLASHTGLTARKIDVMVEDLYDV